MANVKNMRGLNIFISDIRQCQSKEAEKMRVDKELGNIRKHFTSDKQLKDYDRKKYVFKLIYIFMLGHEVEFGHMEVVNLISSPKHSEKQVGYLATSVLLNENTNFLRLVINSIKNDIMSRNETHQTLALACVGNVGSAEFAEALSNEVQKLLVSSTARLVVRKKAALCLLRLYKKNSEVLNVESWSDAIQDLLEERDLGLTLSVCALLEGLLAAGNVDNFAGCFSPVVSILQRLVTSENIPHEYTYYSIPSPWLQVKAMRVLSYFPVPHNQNQYDQLLDLLRKIIGNSEQVRNQNKSNSIHAILLDAIGLTLAFDASRQLLKESTYMLTRFLSGKEPNIRYLGLDALARYCAVPEMQDHIKQKQAEVLEALHDSDVSIRKRALDVLYGICDESNVDVVVDQLLEYIPGSAVTMREELALKIAILAERFQPSQQWYVDSVVALIDRASEYVSESVWFRVVQVVMASASLQAYTAEVLLDRLRKGTRSEPAIKLSAYILGEFCDKIDKANHEEIFTHLERAMAVMSNDTRAIILLSLAKLRNRTNEQNLQAKIDMVNDKYTSSIDIDLQQRASELSAYAQGSKGSALEHMPEFETKVSSTLEGQGSEDGIEAAEKRASDVNSEESALGPVEMSDAKEYTNSAEVNDTPLGLGEGREQEEGREESKNNGVDPFAGISDDNLLAGRSEEVVQPIIDVPTARRKLYSSPTGVLYEDKYLQIGLKSQWQAEEKEGSIALYLGNKYEESLVNLRMSIKPQEKVSIQLPEQMPNAIQAKQQQVVPIKITMNGVFEAMPEFHFSYSLGDSKFHVSKTVHLPAVVTKLLSPMPNITSSDFFSRWRGVHTKEQKVFRLGSTAASRGSSLLRSICQSLNLACLRGFDPNPSNVVCAATFPADSASHTAVLARVEIHPEDDSKACVTVASEDTELSLELRKAVVEALSV